MTPPKCDHCGKPCKRLDRTPAETRLLGEQGFGTPVWYCRDHGWQGMARRDEAVHGGTRQGEAG